MESSTVVIIFATVIVFILLVTLIILPLSLPCVTYDMYGMCIKKCGTDQILKDNKCICKDNYILNGNVCICKNGYQKKSTGDCVKITTNLYTTNPDTTNPSITPYTTYFEITADTQTASDDAILRN